MFLIFFKKKFKIKTKVRKKISMILWFFISINKELRLEKQKNQQVIVDFDKNYSKISKTKCTYFAFCLEFYSVSSANEKDFDACKFFLSFEIKDIKFDAIFVLILRLIYRENLKNDSSDRQFTQSLS